MSIRVVAALAAWSALCPCSVRAETAPVPPEAAGRYTIIRLADDPETHMPRMFVFDPGTARMWVLKASGEKPFFQPVPYLTVDKQYRETETPGPPPP